MDLTKYFNLLGLREEHYKVYLANLEWGTTSITNIARKSGIPRTTIYLLIKDLLKLGLVTQSMKQGNKMYTPADPDYLVMLLEKQKLEIDNSISNLNENMNELKAMQTKKGKKPKVEYLEGSEGIMQAYERSLEAEEILIQCFTQDYKSVVSDKFFDSYFERFFSSDTKSKELLTLGDDEYCSKYGSSKNLQLMVPTPGSNETDMMIYGNTVIFVSFNKDNPYSLIIEDEDIANSMRNMYSQAWEYAKSVDPRIAEGKKVKTEF